MPPGIFAQKTVANAIMDVIEYNFSVEFTLSEEKPNVEFLLPALNRLLFSARFDFPSKSE